MDMTKATNKNSSKIRKLNQSQEELVYNKIAIIVDSFIDTHKINKKDFLKKVFVAAFELIPEAQKGSFFELEGEFYIPIFAKGYDMELMRQLVFDKKEAFIDYECSEISSISVNEVFVSARNEKDYPLETIEILKKLGTFSNFSSLYAPIQVDGVSIGVICLDNFNNSGFSKVSKKILKFYAQLISNFYTQRVYQERQNKMYNDIVTALVSTIEVKDVYTEGHGQRVKEYSVAIAEALKLPLEQIIDIGTASLLHDVGKIGIPSTILNKPGKLTNEEYEIIKSHPEFSKKILEKISDFTTIVNYAYNHHERYDGLGYPRGISGDEIPFASHIIQLADAYDAMTSERSYRKALSKEVALGIIKEECGKQFHPDVVKAALEIFSKLWVHF